LRRCRRVGALDLAADLAVAPQRLLECSRKVGSVSDQPVEHVEAQSGRLVVALQDHLGVEGPQE
jgi:hypothetical protein